jgi:guanine deaminase
MKVQYYLTFGPARIRAIKDPISMAKSDSFRFYIATILNPKSDTKCEYFPEGLLVTKRGPKGPQVLEAIDLKKGLKKYKNLMSKENTMAFSRSVILPGFYDMHFHWVQDDVREMPKDSLLQWLELYTFPAESKFADLEFATKKAHEFFKKLTRAGTLGGACYSSIHEHAVDAAMKEVRGDFVIGNVLMNHHSPKALTQTIDDSLSITKRLIQKYGKRYVFTPRFAISTDPLVMKKGSLLADKAKCFKQSHLSETPGEIDFVMSLYRKLPGFKKVKNYTEIYHQSGMLGRRSLMGHGIHLSKDELKTLSKTKTTIVHCPTSNAPIEEKGLGSGLFDFKRVEKAGVRWVLGSDIGGGPFLSMFDVIRSFVHQHGRAKTKGATYVKALYRATLAGAEVMEFAKKKGNLDAKKEVNFIVVPFHAPKMPKNAEEMLGSLINPLKTHRHEYDELVSHVVYQGEILV